MVLVDIISLYGWNLNHFLKANFDFGIGDLKEVIFRLLPVYQMSSLHSSSWLLVRIRL
jgi:hypothetical protein